MTLVFFILFFSFSRLITGMICFHNVHIYVHAAHFESLCIYTCTYALMLIDFNVNLTHLNYLDFLKLFFLLCQ